MQILSRHQTSNQVYGAGLALILICLLLYLFLSAIIFVYLSLGFVVLLMITPVPFRYVGLLWYALGEVMGHLISRFVLTLVFILVVLPVSLFKRTALRKNMQIRNFRKNRESAFIVSDRTFKPHDFEKPF